MLIQNLHPKLLLFVTLKLPPHDCSSQATQITFFTKSALKRALHLETEQVSHGINAALLMANIKFNKVSIEPKKRLD